MRAACVNASRPAGWAGPAGRAPDLAGRGSYVNLSDMNATPQAPEPTPSSYAEAGVDEEREQVAFSRVMRPWLARTRVKSDLVASITGLASGYFATIMHLPPGPPIALDLTARRPTNPRSRRRSASAAPGSARR